MNETDDLPITASVPDYGRQVFGLGRNASYDAAKRGDFPVFRIGGLFRVPLLVALKLVVGEDPQALAAARARFRKSEANAA